MPNVEGTGHEGRDRIIRAHVRVGMRMQLIREKWNPYDANAIAVCVDTPKFLWFGGLQKIGYLDRSRAAKLAPIMDGGAKLTASVLSMYTEMKFPRVTIKISNLNIRSHRKKELV